MLTAALTNIPDRPMEVLLMAARGEQEVLDRPSLRVMRLRNGALSGSDLGHEPGEGTIRMHQPGEMLLETRLRPDLRRRNQAFH